jgi:hypothetical protein
MTTEHEHDRHARLRADCSRCVGICCVAPAFTASADFAIDKPAGHPCPHLDGTSRCEIHSSLRERGFAGCTAFDCFGAGQQVVQVTLPGVDWRRSPSDADELFGAFAVVQQLHQMLWYLADALTAPAATPLRPRLEAAYISTEAIAGDVAPALRGLDLEAHRHEVNTLLTQVSELVRSQTSPRGPDHAGADLVGSDLTRVDLRGAQLRGASLLGADLRGVDLTGADVLAADLRAADLRGAQMAGALFLTQFQVNGARGDLTTTLPTWITRPEHWS